MPKLKKNSAAQRILAEKIKKRRIRVDVSVCESKPNREARLIQMRETQKLRLQNPTQRDIHRKRLQISQQIRLQSPTNQVIHRKRLLASQQRRMRSPTKRDIQMRRLRESQRKRLQSPTKRDTHKKRLQASQRKRLQSPTKRNTHKKRLQASQKTRLNSPTKRDVHRKRLQASQKKRLESPAKRDVHRKRLRESQRHRLQNPSRRANHYERLKQNQIKRLLNKRKREVHLRRLRLCQQQRISEPARRIIHISRIISARRKREIEEEAIIREKIYRKYLNDRKEGPTYACSSCHRLWFKTSVKYRNVKTLDYNLTTIACGSIEGDGVLLCHTCYNSIHNKKVPILSLANKDLQFPPIPRELELLTELEERFLAPRIPFMSIRAAVSDQQYLVKGRAVNVPSDVPTSVNILPRTFDDTFLVPICFRRKKCYKTNVAFENVRPKVIKDAAAWLINSPLFKHFNIALDLNRLNNPSNYNRRITLPTNLKRRRKEEEGENKEEEKDNQEEEEDNQEEEENQEDEEQINVADDITMLTSAIVFAPGEGRKPESLFAEYVEAQCFLKIYCGELRQKPSGMSLQNWVKSEIQRDDRRCANVTKLFFSALKLRMDKIGSSISFCLRKAKSKQRFKVKDVIDNNQLDQIALHDSGYRVFAVDRGSPAFWELKKKELFSMMRQIGPPTIFLTLSPAETKWLDLLVILKQVVDGTKIGTNDAKLLSYQEKVDLIKRDPVTVARYFQFRMRQLFNLLKQKNSVFRKNDVVDFYIRTEFQQRGSPHLHCLIWMKNAPIYEEDSKNDDVIKFIDELISCSSLLPTDSLELQTHRHTFTCWKKSKLAVGNKTCRFDMPFFPFNETLILQPLSSDECDKGNKKNLKSVRNKLQIRLMEIHKNQEILSLTEFLSEFHLTPAQYTLIVRSGLRRITVFLKRRPHECMINFYNPDLLLLHEANMDIQFITDMYSCATYVLNYLNKANAGMSKLLREADAEIRHGNHCMRDQLRLLANCFLNASEFSAQEAVYYILAMPLSNCSRRTEFINTNRPEKRVAILKNKTELEKLNSDSEDIFTKSSIDHYSARPSDMEFVPLADFISLYDFSKKERKGKSTTDDDQFDNSDEENGKAIKLLDNSGYIHKRKRGKIIRFVNYNENEKTEFVRENVMLFWNWRDEPAMIDSAEDIYQSHYNEIKEVRARYVYKEELLQILHNAEDEVNSDDENENAGTETPVNLRVFEAMDSQVAAQPDADINLAIPDAEGANNNGDDIMVPVPRIVTEEEYGRIISTLNKKQRCFLQHVLHQFKTNALPIYHCVLGGAGVGKSRLIEAIHQTIIRFINMSSNNLESLKIHLCAPTGKAAFGIKGTTLHAAFVLPLNQCGVELKPLSSSTRNKLFTKLKDVKLIIIDEISMVGSRMITQINIRLKEIFHSNEDFAGISVIVFGDFNQLPPVGDRFIFEPPSGCLYDTLIGNVLWDRFTLYTLTEIMRQRDDAVFALALNNLAMGTLDQQQIALFQGRIVQPPLIPDGAIRLYRTNAEVDAYNHQVTERDSNKAVVEALDKVTGQPNAKTKENLLRMARNAQTKDCQGLPFRLELSLNTKYMVTVNINVADGLVNGAVGVLMDIDLRLHRVWLLFPEKDVGRDKRRELCHPTNPALTPIERVIRTTRPSKSPYSVVRAQLPLVQAEAVTIHKSQGGTYEMVAVHLSKGFRRNEIYVALSRCTKLSGLFLTGSFVPPAAPDPSNKVIMAMKCLSNRPIRLSGSYKYEDLDFTILYQNIQSLTNKGHWFDVLNFIKLHQPTIFIASETWTLPSDKIGIDGYEIILRLDAASYRHAYGLAIYSKTDTDCRVLYAYGNDIKGSAICSAALQVNGIGICTGYKPPTTSYNCIQHVMQAALSAASDKSPKVVVLGDFNLEPAMNSNLFTWLGSNGFINQLAPNMSTTNAGTSIDIVYSNFNHYAAVVESFYSHHKQLQVAPFVLPINESSDPVQEPRGGPVLKTSLETTINYGYGLLESLLKSPVVDHHIMRVYLKFVKSYNYKLVSCPRRRKTTLPEAISSYFWPIDTSADGNCFYYAVSRILCGLEDMHHGLRALVAYHMDINDNFLEMLPLALGCHTSRQAVLMDKNFAEILEVLLMSYILRRPINVFTGDMVSSMRFAPSNGLDINLYLNLVSQHYTVLVPKTKRKPPNPAAVLHLPAIDLFESLNI